jgi:malic enzyme
MKVSDIKAELELRSIDFSGCFEKDDLVRRLVLAREQGEADPTIVDKFNEKNLERSLHKSDGADDVAFDPFAAAKADGVDQLPGGMSPEMVQKMASNPELMAVLQNPKMQAVLKDVMEKGPIAFMQYSGDPEVMAMIKTFTAAMGQ